MNHRLEYNLGDQDVRDIYNVWQRLPKMEERTPQYLSYRWSHLMTRYMDIPKIPGPIYTTLVDRRIAIIQRSTGPIVHSSIDGVWGRDYEVSRLESLFRQRQILDDYYDTMRQGIHMAQEEFVIWERKSACK